MAGRTALAASSAAATAAAATAVKTHRVPVAAAPAAGVHRMAVVAAAEVRQTPAGAVAAATACRTPVVAAVAAAAGEPCRTSAVAVIATEGVAETRRMPVVVVSAAVSAAEARRTAVAAVKAVMAVPAPCLVAVVPVAVAATVAAPVAVVGEVAWVVRCLRTWWDHRPACTSPGPCRPGRSSPRPRDCRRSRVRHSLPPPPPFQVRCWHNCSQADTCYGMRMKSGNSYVMAMSVHPPSVHASWGAQQAGLELRWHAVDVLTAVACTPERQFVRQARQCLHVLDAQASDSRGELGLLG